MPIQRVISDTRIPVKIWTNDVEDSAEQQLRNTASLPFIFKHVAAMPDVHFGRGATIGTVIATKGAIIPAAVGVDIGCGMSAVKLPFNIDQITGSETLRAIRNSIERSVPNGRDGNRLVSDRVGIAFNALGETPTEHKDNRVMRNAALQLGSLGGGNHFIEICSTSDGQVWLMLHSGSRNIGKHLAEIHISNAKDLMKQYFIDLPDPDLAFLAQNTPEFKSYLHDLMWAQSFAKANRNEMKLRVLRELSYHVYGNFTQLEEDLPSLFQIDCHHNYTQIENHFGSNVYVTRKGAVSARDGEYGIIPGSMGTRSYIVRGKGNADAFCSCAHGAGRRMSRSKARKTFTKEDFAKQTEGVECRKDEAVLDEIPAAYKSIDEVMFNQTDLVDVMFEIKQFICIKGG